MQKHKSQRDEVRFISQCSRYLKATVLFLLCFVVFPAATFAQDINIKGVVLDKSLDEPIIGASVVVEGNTGIGTITDIDGNFSLKVPMNSTISISYIGYVAQKVKATKDGAMLTIKLQEDSKLLDEVVVVGFGTQKKENLTGSVGVATAKEIQDRPVMLASQALQGLVPGLNISQSDGSLESRAAINIRGRGTIGDGSSGSPLILIDGVEGDINALNPQDIDNISVLKDAASSSIYGAKAPFGVILVTTKSGSEGKTKVNYNNSFRWNTPIRMPEMMDSYSFAQFFNSASRNNGDGVHFTPDWIQRIEDYQNGKITTETIPNPNNPSMWEEGYDGGGNANYNYYKEFYKSSSFSQEHNLSFSGGRDKINYYTSFNILDQGGMMKLDKDTYNRYGATVKVSYDLSDWIRFSYNNRFVREKYKRPANLKNSFYSDLGRQGWPMLPKYDPNGHILNQWILRMADGGDDKKESDNIYQQVKFEFEPIKNWNTSVEAFYTINNNNRHWDTKMTYVHDVAGNPVPFDTDSGVHEDSYKDNQFSLNVFSDYFFSINNQHNFKVLVGTQYQSTKNTVFGLDRSGLIDPNKPEIDLTTGQDSNGQPTTPGVNGSRARYATQGYFGRLNYDFLGRYLLEVNLRYDGSSRFRSGDRWVLSPSFSLGWNIAHEAFWDNIRPIVGTLKLRGSYGQLANQNTNSWYPTYASMGIGATSGSWLINGQKPNTAWAPGILENQNLTWEKIRTTNIGLDYGLFSNRLTGSFDYFIRETRDMLGPAPERPAILGVGVPKANNTNLRDYGFELQIGWQDMLSNGFSYGAKFMLSDYQTKITKYPNITGSLGSYIAGRKMGEIWGYETVGIAKTQEEMDAHLASLPNGGQDALGSKWGAGDIMYKDLSGDGKIDAGNNTIYDHGDRKVIGNSTPRFQFALDLNAAWKGFDLRLFFQGVMKRDVWQGSYYFWGASDGGIWHSTALKGHSDYFREAGNPMGENLNAYYPRPLFNGKNKQTQTKYLLDGSYIRLKNVQLGYTLPKHFTEKFSVSNLRVFFSGENLWTGTSLTKLFDPETVTGGWGGNVYPISRVFSVGFSVNL